MKKRNLFTTVFVASLICIFLSSCLTNSKKYPGFDASDIVEVDVSLVSESVILESWEGDTIYVSFLSNNNKKLYPKVSCDNGIISVVQDNLVPSKTYHCDVKIQYPKHYAKNVMNPKWEISTLSGYVLAKDLTGSVINIDTRKGRINLDRVRSTDVLKVKSVDGQINISGSTVKLDVKTVTGSIRMVGIALEILASSIDGSIYTQLEKPIVFDSKYNSVSGSINIVMSEHPGFILNYASKAGDVHNEFTGANVKGFGIDIYKTGSVVIETASGTGSIWIEKSNK